MSLGMDVGFSLGHIVLDGDHPPAQKEAQQPPSLFGLCLLWPNGRPSQQVLSSCYLLSLERIDGENVDE